MSILIKVLSDSFFYDITFTFRTISLKLDRFSF